MNANFVRKSWLLSLVLPLFTSPLPAQEAAAPLAVAVLNFQEKGESVAGMGEKASLLLSAFLSTNDKLVMVERADLSESLGEMELSLSGTVSNDSAAKIGQLTGAKVLVTGRVFPVGKQIYVVTKVIGVETSRVFGETAKIVNEEELDGAISGLGDKIGEIVAKQQNVLIAKVESPKERMDRLQALIGDKGKGKKVFVSIPEEHLSRAIPDPAVQTEIQLTFQNLGFGLTEDMNAADLIVRGEAFSERALQKGQLIACRARAEIKRLDKSGALISVDRQTEVAIDLAENVAAKSALQKIGSILAERLIKQFSGE